ncbi:MAG: hypothetical protein FWH03_02655 [Firmicutes bacterium]|nr:hypothetical protein [Bacillota bacterium]
MGLLYLFLIAMSLVAVVGIVSFAAYVFFKLHKFIKQGKIKLSKRGTKCFLGFVYSTLFLALSAIVFFILYAVATVALYADFFVGLR